jgi:hypothetical protein
MGAPTLSDVHAADGDYAEGTGQPSSIEGEGDFGAATTMLYSQRKTRQNSRAGRGRCEDQRDPRGTSENLGGLSDQIKYARGWSKWDQESGGPCRGEPQSCYD